MPELLPTRVLARSRRMTFAVVCTLPLCGLSADAMAQTVPTGLRACAAESNPAQRLACYDREMAHRSQPPSEAPGAAHAAQNAQAASQPGSIQPGIASKAATPASRAAVSNSRAPHAASREPAATRHASRWKIFTGGKPWHVTAQVVGLDRWPDAMVLHLDNGQVWRQIGRASGDLSLHTGDTVTIEKHLGSYWLSSRYVSSMQVRLEPR